MARFIDLKTGDMKFLQNLSFMAAGSSSVDRIADITNKRQIYKRSKIYKSSVLKAKVNTDEMEQVCLLYRRKFEKAGIKVNHAYPKVIKKISDADASEKVVLYKVNVIYFADSIIPNESID